MRRAYYADVEVIGTALVYAESAEEAKNLLCDAGVMVAGNKLRHYDVVIRSAIRDEAKS